MSSIMSRLVKDHLNAIRLLDILDEQIDTLRKEKQTDFDLMHDVMIYMTDYPDRIHHPTEDLVFRRLLVRDESMRKPVEALTREHKAVGERGRAFKDALEQVVDGALMHRSRLERLGRDYVGFVRAHMLREEGEVFPRSREVLTETDWEWVRAHIDQREDPVFGPIVAKQFRSLLRFIAERST